MILEPNDPDEQSKHLEELNKLLIRAGFSPERSKTLPTIAELVAEGDALLAKEANTKPTSSCPKQVTKTTSNNPYIIARETVLNGFEEWKRNEILTMEKEKNINNRWYNDFIKEVISVGDSLT